MIVGVTLFLLYFVLLQPSFQKVDVDLLIDPKTLYLLILTTILITLSGYLINDIEDRALDKINKPEKHWIKTNSELRKAKLWYGLILLSGAIIAFYIAIRIDRISWFIIYPIAVLLLYIYAKRLKSTVLWGNILVSLFCAAVAGLLMFAEMSSFSELQAISPPLYSRLSHIFCAYIVYAFTTNLIREIIKDIQDVEGDQSLGIRTLSTQYGILRAQQVAIGITILLITALSLWISLDRKVFDSFNITLSFLTIVAPSLYFLYLQFTARTPKQITFISRFAKIIMVLGLILLMLIR